ncbi:MAG: (5-formylfuran-3-yl)methyl phosphate synthase [Candidatus Heimdallarchaeota archaeon]|nr:(5-formylfuran-3-yl)methyl phosphate synthase [Candidatus Heimdallarchaeota archaeon]
MQLLVSPQNLDEALECVNAFVDIIDIKNPVEGSLGANFPWVIQTIREAVPKIIPISATVGDVPYKPGSVALAALGAATAGADFVKVGLLGTKTVDEAIEVMQAVTKTIDRFQLSVSVVAAGYAEGNSIGSISPLDIPFVAEKASCDFAMIDTYDKTAKKSIFDTLSYNSLESFIAKARKFDIGTALGGSINLTHIPLLHKLQPDIVGIRGAVCFKGDRLNGKIQAKLITEFAEKLKKKE